MREIPFRTAGKDGQALSVSPALTPAVIQKSPSVVALSRVASGELALPVRLRLPVAGARKKRVFLRRLSGLLSGCPPTDTRPQARAKLGDFANKLLRRAAQAFWSERMVGREVSRRRRGARRKCSVRHERLDAFRGADELHH